MAVTYEKIETWPEADRESVARATRALEGIMQAAFDRAEIHWRFRTGPDGRAEYALAVTDPGMEGGTAETRLYTDELQNETRVRIRLLQLWSDLLREYERRLKRNFTMPAGV